MQNIELAFFYIKILTYCFAAIAAGYTVADLDTEFLDQATNPEWQAVIIAFVAAGFFNFEIAHWRRNIIEILTITTVVTGALQLLRCKFKKNKK